VTGTSVGGGAPAVKLRAAQPDDLTAIIQLLVDAGLPTAGIPADLERFIVAEHAGRLVGAAGLERYDRAGLLRSVVVALEARGTGLGTALVERILCDSAADGVADVYLLTTTAERYFPRHGFKRVSRESVPAAVRASVEFREACPATAAVMHRRLAAVRGLPEHGAVH
jgi:amino-acid N-acetyltransferase